MNYRTYSRSLVGIILGTGFACAMLAMSFAHNTFTGSTAESYYPFKISFTVERHFDNVMQTFAEMEFVAPRPTAEHISAPERMSGADVLFASLNQPGQDWRIAATAYRHIDPGRRLAA